MVVPGQIQWRAIARPDRRGRLSLHFLANDQRRATDDLISTERWQLHQIFAGHRLHGLSRSAPGGEAAYQDERVESFFPQHERHPGARGFARSSAVEVDVSVWGQPLQFFFEIVGFNSDRTFNARGVFFVVAVAAHVDHQDSIRFLRL